MKRQLLAAYAISAIAPVFVVSEKAGAQYCSAYVTNSYGQSVCVQMTTPQQQRQVPVYAPQPGVAQPEPYNPSFNPGRGYQQPPTYTQPAPTWGSQRPVTHGLDQMQRGVNFFMCGGDSSGVSCRR